jgi:ubiquitin-protein ligase E3 A
MEATFQSLPPIGNCMCNCLCRCNIIFVKNRLVCLTIFHQWLLVDSIAKQFNAFAKGFFSVCGGPALEMFKPQELELLICGSPTLDFHALEDVAILEDG